MAAVAKSEYSIRVCTPNVDVVEFWLDGKLVAYKELGPNDNPNEWLNSWWKTGKLPDGAKTLAG